MFDLRQYRRHNNLLVFDYDEYRSAMSINSSNFPRHQVYTLYTLSIDFYTFSLILLVCPQTRDFVYFHSSMHIATFKILHYFHTDVYQCWPRQLFIIFNFNYYDEKFNPQFLVLFFFPTCEYNFRYFFRRCCSRLKFRSLLRFVTNHLNNTGQQTSGFELPKIFYIFIQRCSNVQ